MRDRYRSTGNDHGSTGSDRLNSNSKGASRPEPGKQTLTGSLVGVQRKAQPGPVAAPTRDPGEMHEAAAAGVQGSGSQLPHLAEIQKAFGRHDISDVSAHVGGKAADASDHLGAEAYATGQSVAFRSAPSLHTAAHEAAHVVQQRAGVQLKGGLGEVGDAYEKHADQVADRVVAGRSAEDLIDQQVGASPGKQMGAGPVQAVQSKALQLEAETDATHAKDHAAAAVAKADTSPQGKFVAKYGHGAVELENKDGVPALFTLAQAALESGWGKSAIGNALFGIKADASWKGKKQLVTTTEFFNDDQQGHRFPEVISITKITEGKNAGKYKYTVKDWFRDYETVEEGLGDHSAFLIKNKRYWPAFNTETPEDFAMAVAKAGYATAAGYGDTLKSIIQTVRSHWPADLGPIPAGNAKAKTGGKPTESASTGNAHEDGQATQAGGPAPAIDAVRSGKEVLRRGMSGPGVGYCQQKLGMQGKAVDNDFGGKTETAVRNFQQKHSLPPSGIVDARTLQTLEGGAPNSTGGILDHLEHTVSDGLHAIGDGLASIGQGIVDWFGGEETNQARPGQPQTGQPQTGQPQTSQPQTSQSRPQPTTAGTAGQAHPEQAQPAGNLRRSGADWWGIANANGWTNSTDFSALDSSWGPKAQAFVEGLRAGGAQVHVTAGLRHPNRAFLMHYAWGVAHGQYTPAQANDACHGRGINIEWNHGTTAASQAAAQALVKAFGLVHQASITSNHIHGLAIDIDISNLPATITMNGRPYTTQRGASGVDAAQSVSPIGRDMGVIWYGSTDAVHWSHNGR